MAGPVTDVVFVVGKGRSGSTLLDMLLGQVPGVFSTGELRYLWEWGFLGGYLCGCGESVPDCPVWSEVERRLVTRVPEARDRRWAAVTIDRALRWPRVPMTLVAARRGSLPGWLEDFGRLYAALYAAIGDVAGAGAIIDSSKWPAHPAALGLVAGVRPAALHLVRDPRGVATSYLAGKETGTTQPAMPRFGAAHSSLSWLARNGTVEMLRALRAQAPSLRLRYEDLVDDPASALGAALGMVGITEPDLDFLGSRGADLAPTHTVGGNPGRFSTGTVSLRRDDRWRRDLSARDRRIVETLTRPMAQRYGYR
jgi:hypothetical protein